MYLADPLECKSCHLETDRQTFYLLLRGIGSKLNIWDPIEVC